MLLRRCKLLVSLGKGRFEMPTQHTHYCRSLLQVSAPICNYILTYTKTK